MSTEPTNTFRWHVLALWAVAWIATALVFSLWPDIDLATSAFFWEPGSGFVGNQSAILSFLHRIFNDLHWPITLGGLGWLAAASFRPALRRHLGRGIVAFVLLTLILGPGGLGKATKDNWGRARPNAVQEFGGTKTFTPALVKTDQCERNCSFFSGHASFAFWFGALALAFGRQRLALGLSLGIGLPIGLMRIAQGGHFLSDVLFAGLFVMTLNILLYHLLRRPFGLGRKNQSEN